MHVPSPSTSALAIDFGPLLGPHVGHLAPTSILALLPSPTPTLPTNNHYSPPSSHDGRVARSSQAALDCVVAEEGPCHVRTTNGAKLRVEAIVSSTFEKVVCHAQRLLPLNLTLALTLILTRTLLQGGVPCASARFESSWRLRPDIAQAVALAARLARRRRRRRRGER